MSVVASVRPTAHGHIPYFGQYIDLVPDGNLIEILETQIVETAGFLRSFSFDQAVVRPAPDEWNLAEIVGHLSDTERVLGYRALRIARADRTLWESIDFAAYVENGAFEHRSLDSLVDEFMSVRASTIAFLRNLDASAWERRMPDEWSCRTVGSLAYVIAGHELHHVEDLKTRW